MVHQRGRAAATARQQEPVSASDEPPGQNKLGEYLVSHLGRTNSVSIWWTTRAELWWRVSSEPPEQKKTWWVSGEPPWQNYDGEYLVSHPGRTMMVSIWWAALAELWWWVSGTHPGRTMMVSIWWTTLTELWWMEKFRFLCWEPRADRCSPFEAWMFSLWSLE